MQRFLNDFFRNPGGSGSSFLNIKATTSAFDSKYAQVSEKIVPAYYSEKDSVYIAVKIPSSIDGVYYDVVVKFDKTKKSTGNTLNDYEIHLFSNSPSFTYTFTYAYLKNGLLIKEFRDKLSSQMLKEPAKSKNSYNVISYDFSIYAALKFIIDNKYTTIDSISSLQTFKSFKEFHNYIQHAEKLEKTRAETKAINDAAKKKEEQDRLNAVKSAKFSNLTDEKTGVRDAKQVKNVKNVSGVKQVKKSKRI